jgi:ribosomal protein L29
MIMNKQTFLKDIRTHDANWLQAEINKRYEGLRTLRFDIGFGNLNSLSQFRSIKKDLAQLWTVLGEKLSDQQPTAKD